MMKELFLRYGVAALFASVRRLHIEVIELKEELSRQKEELGNLYAKIELDYQERILEYKNLASESDYTTYEDVIEVPDHDGLRTYSDIDVASNKDDTIYGKNAQAFSIHKGARELIQDAKKTYESRFQRAKPDVTISDEKANYYVERARDITNSEN